MRIVAISAGIVIAAIGIAGIAMPSALLKFAQSLNTPAALYTVVAVRLMFGAVLVWVAPGSRMPRTVRIIGTVIIVAALLALGIGVERAEALLNWWSSLRPLFMRAWAGLALIFGVFIAYAVAPTRRAA